ncbi:MAG: sigma-54-dependent transcriptional regulator [Bryobacteraceae bacterium]
MKSVSNGRRILVAEDEPEVRNYLAMALRCHGYEVDCAEDGNEVLNCLQAGDGKIAALILDIMMPRKDGMETLREIRKVNRDLPVIMVSSAVAPLSVVEAMRSGANDFLGKPVSHEDLHAALKKALNGSAPPEPVERAAATGETESFYAGSPAMKRIQAMTRQIGMCDVPVLIQGETGTGKEVVARQLHAQSLRSQKPFLKLNCAALPSELVESELFGYERGAFTGAFQKKAGMFELADRGTLLLDEIGDMDFKLQAKLLQVLQDQEFQHLGGKDTIRVNVRVIAATHRDLEKAIADQAFREDLYYRLNVIRIELPPLRERREEIIPLCEMFLRKHAANGDPVPVLTPALKQALINYHWPGNVRELENLARRYWVLRDPEMLVSDLRSRAIRKVSVSVPAAGPMPILARVDRAKQEAEAEAIHAALTATKWNRKQAAELLHIDYKALLYKMRKLSIGETPHGPQKANGSAGSVAEPEPLAVRAAGSH